MLLSGDGFVPVLPPGSDLPGLAPVDIVLVNDQTDDKQPDQTAADTLVLIDTSPAVPQVEVATATTNTVTTLVTTTTIAPTVLTPPADPLVDSAADFSVLTLTTGNGPPAAGASDSASGSDLGNDLSAWDPPLGGFNFTATNADIPTRDADYAALTLLLTSGTGAPVTLMGSIVNRAGANWAAGTLSLEGTLTFSRHQVLGSDVSDANGDAVFAISFTSLSGQLVAGGVTLNLTVGSGAFLVSGNLLTPDLTGGLAGTANISSITVAGLSVTNTVTFSLTDVDLTLNTTGGDTTGINVGGSGVNFAFSGASQQNFIRVGGTMSMSITTTAVSVSLGGDFGFEVVSVSGTPTITFALAGGTASMTVSGVTLTASSLAGAFMIKTSGVAGWASVGGITATGLPSGFSFGELSSVSVNLNTTGADASATNIPVGSGTTSFSYTGSAQQNFFRVTGTVAINVAHGGLSTKIKGTVTFDRSVDTVTSAVILRVAVLDAASSFTAGSTTLAITDIDGAFVLKTSGFAGRATVGGITLTGVTGFTFSVTSLLFEINTTNTAVSDSIATGGSPVILDFTAPDRQQFFRIQGGVVLGVDLGGIAVSLDGTFYFEQYDPDGAGTASNVVKFAALGANASFTAGSVKLEVTGVDGGFLINNAGIAGFVTADDVSLTGIPGVTLDATGLSFAINTTGAAAVGSFDIVGGSPVNFDFSAADELSFVSVGGTLAPLGVELGAVSVEVTGSIAFYGGTVDGTEVVKIGFEDLSASVTIGPVTAELTNVDGIILLLDAGIAGRVTFEELEISGITGFSLTATNFAFEFNDTGLEIDEALTIGAVSQTLQYTAADNETDFFRGSGTASLAFTSGGFSTTLTGTFGFEQFTMPDSSSVVKFAFTEVDFEIGFGASGPKLVVDNANGFFIFGDNTAGDASYAGKLEIDTASLVGVTGLTLTVDDFSFEVNTFGEAVDAEITRPSLPSFELDFTAAAKHDFIALGGTLNLTVAIGGFSSTLTGTFYFEQATIDTVDYIKISVSTASFSMEVGSVELSATDINGAFLILGDGTSAGKLSIGHLGLTGISGLTFTVDEFALEFNNTGEAVDVDIPVPGGSPVHLGYIDPEFHDFIRVGGTLDVVVDLGGFSTSLHATFLFEQTIDKIKIGVKEGAFNLTVGSVTFSADQIDGAFVFYNNGTKAIQLTIGHVGLTGITGLTFTVDDFFLNINDTGGAVHETLTFGDGSEASIDFDEDILAIGGTLDVGVDLGGFSASLHATFLFEQTASTIKIGVKEGAISLTVGSVTFAIDQIDGAFVFYNNGTKAVQLSIGHIGLTGITGLTFTVDDFFLSINDTGGEVHETLTFGDGSEASIDFDEDILAIGGTLDLALSVGTFTAGIHGTFLFEKTAGKIKIGLKDAGMIIAVGPVTFTVDGMNGAFVIYDGGTMALHVDIATVSLTGIPGVSFVASDFFLDINNTGGAVHEALTFGDGSTVSLDFDEDLVIFGGTIEVGIGGTAPNHLVELRAENVVIDTSATGDEHVFEAALLSGSITIGPLGTITVTAQNFAVTADGELDNLDEDSFFIVSVDFGGSGTGPSASSFQWPAWLPIRIENITLVWEDIGADPGDFILILSATIGPLPGLTTLNFSGMVQNLRLDVGKLLDGEFPILGFDAAAVQISGNLFGLEVSGGIVVGMIDFDEYGEIIDRSLPENIFVEADGTIFYFGISAEVMITGIGGAGFRLGMADIDPTEEVELVPLEAFLTVAAPVVIEPISGLTLGEFTAGIQFASTLSDTYADVDVLKTLTIASFTNPNLDQWEQGLRVSTLRIYNGDSSGAGPANVWDQPMVITAAVTMYSSYISRQALEGTLLIRVDTEGRVLLIGELLFGGGNLKLDAKLYADFSDTVGGVEFSFYASVGATAVNPKYFELWGELDIRILDANGVQLSGDPDAPATVGGAAILQVELTGGARFVTAGVLVVEVQGTIKLEVDFSEPDSQVTTLVFNAQVGIVFPTPNPLGPNFGEIAGTVVILTTSSGDFDIYGAVSIIFNPASLAQYGLDIDAQVFLQLNTTAVEQEVTLEYFDGDTEAVIIREESFSLYVKGNLSIGPPNSAPEDAFITMTGFVIIEINSDGLTLVFDVDLTLAPGGTRLLTLDATGFMRINGDGIAARLDMTLVTDFPPESGLEFTADFTLIINTTEEIVSYDIPAFVLTGAPDELTSITIAQAAPEIGGDLSVAADGVSAPGEMYFLVAVEGSLTAMSLTLEGNFFLLVTEEMVQLQVNATLEFDAIGELTVSGFLEISSDGAAGLLEITFETAPALEDFGLEIDAEFVLAFNTYDHAYTLPNAVADQFGLPHGSTLVANLIRLEISGSVTIAGAMELTGRFYFEQTPSQTTIEVDATMVLPVLGTLRVDGDLVLITEGAHQGAVGSLVATLDSGAGLASIGITFSASITLKVNTTDIAQDDPGSANPAILIEADTVELDMSGAVTVLDAFTFNGHFYFRKSGSDLHIRFDATLSITVGTFTVTGEVTSTSAGFFAKLTLQLQTSPSLASMGFKLEGDFLLVINSTNASVTLSGLTGNLAAFNGESVGVDGILIYVKGKVVLLDTLELVGTFKLTSSPGILVIEITADISLAGLVTLHIEGGAGIYSDGIAIRIALTDVSFGFSGLFEASGDFLFELNTSNQARTLNNVSLAANSFHIAVTDLTLEFLGVLTITGSLDISYSSGVFRLEFQAGIDFFGIGSINADGFFDSDGNYRVHVEGTIEIGAIGFFGLRGHVEFLITGVGEGITSLSASVDGTVWIVGISLGFNASVAWDAASGRLRAHASVTIDFFFFSVTIGGDFDLGYIKSTITYQAGSAGNGTVWDESIGGALHVNVGARSVYRNYSLGDTKEQIFIRQGTDGRIEVEVFGKKKKYANVTSVHIDSGSDDDFIYIDDSVTVPVFINTGEGSNIVQHEGSGNSTITTGNGNDVIDGGSGIDTITTNGGSDIVRARGGNDVINTGSGDDVVVGGTGVDSVDTGSGADNFTWSVGDGNDNALNLGSDHDTLTLIGTDSIETVTVSGSGSNFTVSIAGASLSTTGGSVEALVADLLGGNDNVTVNYLGSSALKSVDLLVGNGADTVTLHGNDSGADVFRVTSSTDQLLVSKVATLESTTSLVDYRIHQGTYPTDTLVIHGNGGNDTIDAHNVVHSKLSLELFGDAGSDTILGSSFNDDINGGTENDFLTGGPGLDTFTDTGGSGDELIEFQDVNFSLNGWTLTSGSVSENLPGVFEHIRLNGGNSANTFTMSNLVTVVTLNGTEGSDVYVINLKGSGTSTINISDSGTGVGFPNTNTLRINGTADVDNVLMRRNVFSVGEDAHLETINFNGMSRFDIYGGNGNDVFIVDETTVAGDIYGELGDDSFYVGRILALEGQPAPAGITTIDTTRGFLSYGNRAALKIHGGDSQDYFEINHNQAGLELYGDNGDDLFLLRTFLQEGSELSTVNGGSGVNTIQYVQNGPVFIDGGAGFDRIILEGTEADDVFIITDQDIFGGGRQVTFINIEGIVILGGAGNDTIYVLGNGLPLEIQGGTGNDTVHIGGQAPNYVFDAPEIIVDPEPYTTLVPVYSDPFTISITLPGFFSWGGSFPWFHWIPPVTITITFPAVFLRWQEVITDPPPYAFNPPPITYKFSNVDTFNGVVNGVEIFESTNATPIDPGASGATPTSRKNLGTINAPVKVVGGPNDDSMFVHLQGTTADLSGSLLTVPQIDTAGVPTGGQVGQLLGLGLPGAFSSQGRQFLGGITFSELENAQLDLGSGHDTFTVNGTHDLNFATINGNNGDDIFHLKASGTGGTLTVNGGSGTDTFNLGSNGAGSGILDNLQGAIVINGGSGTDTLNLNDASDGGVNVLNLTGSTITGMDMGSSVNYSFVEGLNVHFGSGDDIANVQGTSVTTTLNLNNGNDAFYVSSTAAVTAATRATTTSLGGVLDNILAGLVINAGEGTHLGMVSDASSGLANGTSFAAAAVINDTTLTGFAPAVITYTYTAGTGNLSGGLHVFSGSGADWMRIDSTLAATVTFLDGDGGNDEILVRAISGPTTVRGGSGDDNIRVSTNVAASNGTLNSIGALLTVDGDGGTNQLFLDDTADPAGNVGTLTGTRVTGFGLAGGDSTKGITYSNLAHLALNLGSNTDTLSIVNTHAGTTEVNLNGGSDTTLIENSTGQLTVNGGADNDIFNVRGLGGPASINTGPGSFNTVNLGHLTPGSPGSLDDIDGKLTISGGSSNDTVNVDDRANGNDNAGILSNNRLTGLGMADDDPAKGVEYSGIEFLNINLGSGNDTFTILSTHASTATFLGSNSGNDRIDVRTISGFTSINVGEGADQVFVGTNAGLGDSGGNVNSISASLVLNGGPSGTAVVNVDDTGDTLANIGNLTGTLLTNLGMAGSINYTAISTLNINLGSGGDTFTIESTHSTLTNLDSGGGQDTVNVRTIAGLTNIFGAGDNDTVVVGSTAPSTVNGISALLTVDGGAGSNNALFINDAGDTADNTGNLTGTRITGLGMAGGDPSKGVTYGNFAHLGINLGSGHDTFTISSTHAGSTLLSTDGGNDTVNVVSIAGLTSIFGDGGDDVVNVNPAHQVGTNPIGALLNLNGNDGRDRFFIKLSGAGHSLVNVYDTGNPLTGADDLTVDGTPGGDTFLLRKDFLVLLQYVDGAQQGTYERINYNPSIDGKLTINALAGVNYFAIDDNSAVTVINGGNEGDTFQVGQVFGNSFIGEGFATGDLIATTRGLLSPGVSYRLSVNAGTGDDLFQVYHNRAVLDLDGGDGDDTFVVRAFALAGSVDGTEVYDPLRGSTNVATGGGTNKVTYAVNAPVAIDGGSGFNTLVIIGTEFADAFVVTENGVFGAGLFVSFINIQQLIVHLAEGNDHVWVLGTPNGSSVRIVGGLGSDTFHLGGTPDPVLRAVLNAAGQVIGTELYTFAPVTTFASFFGPLFIDGGVGDGVPPLAPGIGLPGEVTGPLPAVGNPNLFVDENDQVDAVVATNTGNLANATGVLTLDRLHGLGLQPDLLIAGNPFLAGVRFTELEEVAVYLGSGDDNFTIENTFTGRTYLDTGTGSDTVNVRTLSGHTTIRGNSGNDTFNVGTLAPATGGTLTELDSLLTLDGGADNDTVNVDHRADTDGNTGWLTNTTLTGLEMGSDLSAVNDLLSVRIIATGGSFVLTHGAASVTLAHNASEQTVTGALWTLLGNRNAVAYRFGDTYLINFQGELEGQSVALGVSGAGLVNGSVEVMQRIDGINYYGVDTLNIDLGSGADVMNVRGTTAVTNLNTHDGDDRVYVSSVADLTNATSTDFLLGDLDLVLGTLNVDAGVGRNLLMVSDEAATAGDGSIATPVLVTNSLIRGMAPADITYRADAAGDFAPGITLWFGSGADVIRVDSTHLRAGLRTITTLNTGAGNDRVTVDLSAVTDDFFVLHTQAGDDFVDGSTSSLPLVVFGGDDSDTITGGSAGDILFGDGGRVHYLSGASIVAILGGGGPGDLTDGLIHLDYAAFTVLPADGNADTLSGLAGDDLILGGAAGDDIDAGSDHNTVLGDHGTALRAAFGSSSATTTVTSGDLGLGGDDDITTGGQNDIILGGAGSDTIDAGNGYNVVLGDEGSVQTSGFLVSDVESFTTFGAGDTIDAGNGFNLVIGGFGQDEITTAGGTNVLLGDQGLVHVLGPTLIDATTHSPDTGARDIIVTGDGTHWILGGDADDDITAGNGYAIVFGDHGQVALSAGGIVNLLSIDFGSGGDDFIGTGNGSDLIIGGLGVDEIDGGEGNNVVLGDHGEVITTSAGVHDLIRSLEPTYGTGDIITTGAGNDVIIGGAGADVIHAGAGRNVVLGDHGTLDYAAGDLRTATSSDYLVGGDDLIDSGLGADLIIGGLGLDEIAAGDGANVVLGDQGTVLIANSVLIDVYTEQAAIGDVDTISTGSGSDVILGGLAGDHIEAGDGANFIAGDHAELHWVLGILARLLSTDFATGGFDSILSGSGADMILAGPGEDDVNAGEGLNLVFGDNGDATFVNGVRVSFVTLSPENSTDDDIVTGAGDDTILAGAGDDEIDAGNGSNVVLADEGELSYGTDGILDLAISIAVSDGGNDDVSTGSGRDLIIGGNGEDDLNGGAGDDMLIGDNGRIDLVLGLATSIETIAPAVGGDDVLEAGAGHDIVLGGQGADQIRGDGATELATDGEDVIFGDNAHVNLWTGAASAFGTGATLTQRVSDLTSADEAGAIGGDDSILGGGGSDLIFGGNLADTIRAGSGSDLVFGDNGSALLGNRAVSALTTLAARLLDRVDTAAPAADESVRALGGDDTIYGEAGDDIVFGGRGGDRIDAGSQDDLVFGDSALIDRNGRWADTTNPRFRLTQAGVMYDLNGVARQAATWQSNPAARPAWADFLVAMVDHADTTAASLYGSDYIAGGAHADTIFGQLGDDVIQGDGSIDAATVFAHRDADNNLVLQASFEAATDGDDYIEGNGGSDVVFGGLGQDDIIGDNSSLFGLALRTDRPVGSDLLFGGAGTRIDRNDAGQVVDVHSRDSDTILGDNGNIYRVVTGGASNQFRTFNYDNYGPAKIIPRIAEWLDYTPGGADENAASALLDRGQADEIHGEGGDDFIHGWLGDDVLFGDGQDDDLVGGTGADWITGGMGDDGVLGDDGRLFTSRNGLAEPLYGIAAVTNLNALIKTAGSVQQATINVAGLLKKTAILEPFNLGADDYVTPGTVASNDILFGGLGNDALHGGAGDDAISGTEALPEYFAKPYNPGNYLKFGVYRAGEFAAYDEYNPRTKLWIDPATGIFAAAGGTSVQFILNFLDSEIDGSDVLFGDLGNDWLVGGLGRDNIYGGWGDDLHNADDLHDTNGGLNDVPETDPTYEDRVFGGAGRDILIGNTGGDRLIDWAGEFNSYIVPFAPFGLGTISRALAPQISEFLYALSASDGADPTRAAKTGADPVRNGEPFGELGLVRQQDFAWSEQTGAPDDPQPGNIPGGSRDVLRSANFDSGSAQGFVADSGTWQVSGGKFAVAPTTLGGDAVSVFNVTDPLPNYFEITATINAKKPLGGAKANTYLIFDYQGPSDFKFAGINVATNKLEMGYRNASGWHVVVQSNILAKPDKDYNMLLAVNGVTATLLVDNKTVFSYAFAPRVIDGYSFNLNTGYVGIGTDNASGTIDNVRVQILPPAITLEQTENFNDGSDDLLGGSLQGLWTVGAGLLNGGTLAGQNTALKTVDLDLGNNSIYVLNAQVKTGKIAGVVFDYYGPTDFKFAGINVETKQIIIGHQTKQGWTVDASIVRNTLNANTIHAIEVSLKGTTVSVSIDGQAALGYVFNSVLVDGEAGTYVRNGTASFDSFTLKTNDEKFRAPTGGSFLLAAYAPLAGQDSTSLSTADLTRATTLALNQLAASGATAQQLAMLRSTPVGITSLDGLALGWTDGSVVRIDANAAGFGWNVGSTGAGGRMDLVRAVLHEYGHLLGHDDLSGAGSLDQFMSEHLTPGSQVSSGLGSARSMGAADAPGSLSAASSRLAGSGVFDGASASFRSAASFSISMDGLSLHGKAAASHGLLSKLDEESDSLWLI